MMPGQAHYAWVGVNAPTALASMKKVSGGQSNPLASGSRRHLPTVKTHCRFTLTFCLQDHHVSHSDRVTWAPCRIRSCKTSLHEEGTALQCGASLSCGTRHTARPASTGAGTGCRPQTGRPAQRRQNASQVMCLALSCYEYQGSEPAAVATAVATVCAHFLEVRWDVMG